MSNTNSNTAAVARALTKKVNKLEKGKKKGRKNVRNNRGRFRRPRGPPRSVREFRMPNKMKKAGNYAGKGTAKRLGDLSSLESPYYNTLANPFQYTGAKIPDLDSFETSTFQSVVRFTPKEVVDSTTGEKFYGVFLTGMYITSCVWQLDSSAGGGTVLTWSQPNLGGSVAGALPNDIDIIELFREIRLVSGGVAIMPATSSLDDSGTCLMVPFPGWSTDLEPGNANWTPIDFFEAISYDLLKNVFVAREAPIKSLKYGACACYKPTGFDSFKWHINNQSPTEQGHIDNPYYGGLCLIIRGTTSLTGTAPPPNVVISLNYEAIPNESTMSLVNPDSSPVDLMELSHAMNRVKDKPMTAASAGEAVQGAKTGVTHNKNNKDQGGFLGKILSAITDIAPVVASVVSMI